MEFPDLYPGFSPSSSSSEQEKFNQYYQNQQAMSIAPGPAPGVSSGGGVNSGITVTTVGQQQPPQPPQLVTTTQGTGTGTTQYNQYHHHHHHHHPVGNPPPPPGPGIVSQVSHHQPQVMSNYRPQAFHNSKASNNNPAPKSEVTQTRKRISPQQTKILEAGFQRHPKPDKTFREHLAERTGLPQRNIQIWFQNRRAKAKNNREPGFVKQEKKDYTLNPPPQHHSRPIQQHPPPELFRYPSSNQITSQVIHIPTNASTPLSATSSNWSSSDGYRNNSITEFDMSPALFGTTVSPTFDTRNSIASDSDDHSLLTPISTSLQSPSTSPFLGSSTTSANTTNKRPSATDSTAAAAVMAAAASLGGAPASTGTAAAAAVPVTTAATIGPVGFGSGGAGGTVTAPASAVDNTNDTNAKKRRPNHINLGNINNNHHHQGEIQYPVSAFEQSFPIMQQQQQPQPQQFIHHQQPHHLVDDSSSNSSAQLRRSVSISKIPVHNHTNKPQESGTTLSNNNFPASGGGPGGTDLTLPDMDGTDPLAPDLNTPVFMVYDVTNSNLDLFAYIEQQRQQQEQHQDEH